MDLVKEGSGVAANVLYNRGVELRKVRLAVEELVQTGPEMVTMAKLPHTPRAKKVIEYAMEEARDLRHNYVGTEHLLLGLLREREGVATHVLLDLGLELDQVREEVLVLLGRHGSEGRLPKSAPATGRTTPLERFTDRARVVMQLANQESQRFKHEYIGTEHILLGLVKEGSGVAANVLKNLGVNLRKVRVEVEKLVQTGPEAVTIGKLPHTPRAKKVIEYAMEEARSLGHNYVGTEHLLLGELREAEGVGAVVLMNLGLHVDMVREAVLDVLGHGGEAGRLSQWPVGRASTVSWVPGYAISNFSRGARETLENTERAARELDHGNVSTAHLLLSLVKGGETIAGRVLRESGLAAEAMRKALESPLMEFPPWPVSGNPDYTTRLCEALQAAMREARHHSPKRVLLARLDELQEQKEQALGAEEFETAARLHEEATRIKSQLPERDWHVEPEHLLLGLLCEPHGTAVRIMQDLGLHVQQVRTEVLREMGGEGKT